MHSEPPPKDSANAKAVGVSLEDPRSLFVPWTISSIFSAADIVFLVTVLPSQRVPLRSSYQQSTFQTLFTLRNSSAISLYIAAIKRLCGAMDAEAKPYFTSTISKLGLPTQGEVPVGDMSSLSRVSR